VKTTESRFKPKNIRRDARELEDMRKKEKARLDALAAEEASREAFKARAMGRGRGMRGRGDAMGRGAGRGAGKGAGRGRGGTASGIFGVVPEALRELALAASEGESLTIYSREKSGISSLEGFRRWWLVTKWRIWPWRTEDI
jgi:hypothetical protein